MADRRDSAASCLDVVRLKPMHRRTYNGKLTFVSASYLSTAGTAEVRITQEQAAGKQYLLEAALCRGPHAAWDPRPGSRTSRGQSSWIISSKGVVVIPYACHRGPSDPKPEFMRGVLAAHVVSILICQPVTAPRHFASPSLARGVYERQRISVIVRLGPAWPLAKLFN
jgi:hypothetical protein